MGFWKTKNRSVGDDEFTSGVWSEDEMLALGEWITGEILADRKSRGVPPQGLTIQQITARAEGKPWGQLGTEAPAETRAVVPPVVPRPKPAQPPKPKTYKPPITRSTIPKTFAMPERKVVRPVEVRELPKVEQIICPECNGPFKPLPGQRWCSTYCRRQAEKPQVHTQPVSLEHPEEPEQPKRRVLAPKVACEQCGVEFKVRHSGQRFCCRACYEASRAMKPCPVCKGPTIKRSQTCSRKCERANHKRKCLNCGEPIRDDNSIGYCTTLGGPCRLMYTREKQRERRRRAKEQS